MRLASVPFAASRVMVLLLSVSVCDAPRALAQVRPLPGDGRPAAPPVGQGVTPLPQRPRPGSVQPLPPAAGGGVTEVLAIGTATVFNGNATAARQAALQSAYAEAVSRGAGVDVGRMTVVRNVRAVTDVVASRSRGFVKSYEVLSDGLLAGDPPRYEIRIRAVIATETQTGDDTDSLKLFLEVIGRPTILIMLPDSEVPDQTQGQTTRVQTVPGTLTVETSPARSDPPRAATPGLTALGGDLPTSGSLRAAESAVAQAFARYGYPVLTSDDVLAGGTVSRTELDAARRGVTTSAIAVAKAAGADLLLIGLLRVSTQRVSPQGVDFVSATTEASAKALVVSNGYVLDAFHRTVTKAHPNSLAAVSATLDAVATEFASSLAWKIPSILSAQPRITRLHLDHVTLAMAQQVKAALEKLEGVDAVRFATIPTTTRQEAVLELLSSYVLLPQDELVTSCALAMGRVCQVLAADKFALKLNVIA